MPTCTNILTSLALLLCSFCGYSQTVTPHPVPEEFASDYYIVTVNGQNVPVFHAGLNVYFASFDFTGTVDVSVKANYNSASYSGQTSNKEAAKVDPTGYWRGEAVVRPLTRGIKPRLDGLTVSFSLAEAGQYSVERSGPNLYKDDALILFTNRPDAARPSLAAKNVIHLKPGIHNRHIDLKSGQTLFMEAGAVLFGSINVWNAQNVSILGRGTVVYYGPQSETHDDGWKHQKYWHPLTTHNVQGLTVRGITFVGRSRTWSIQTHTTFDAVFDNIKVLAVNPQNINGDGIDWYGGGRTKVVNSFIRSMDDCFAFFTPNSSLDMWATTKNSVGEVRDIHIENCVLWTTLANIFRIGFNGQALTTDNVVLKNTDVIHTSKGEWHAPWSVLCAVSPNRQGKANHSNYRIEGVRVEEPIALLGFQNPESRFTGLLFKDSNIAGEPVPSLVRNQTSGVTVENVRINGKSLVTEADLPLREGSAFMQPTGPKRVEPTLQSQAPFKVGFAIDPDHFRKDPRYAGVITREAGSITAANYMKPSRISPQPGKYDFEKADFLAEVARKRGMRLHGHALVWFIDTSPDWLKQIRDSTTLETTLRAYIQTVGTHFRGKVASWDVVNEAVEDNETGAIRTQATSPDGRSYLNLGGILGTDYVARMFMYAHAADPDALLFYNDYRQERFPKKLEAILNMVHDFKRRNIPIHGLGLQMHINIDTPNEAIENALRKTAATGLLIHISELDVALNPKKVTPFVPTGEALARQAAKYRFVVGAYRRLVPPNQQYGITMWNVGDGDSWIPGHCKCPDFPLLFDTNYTKKPAYQAFRDGLH